MKRQAPQKAASNYALYLKPTPRAPDRKFVLARLKKLVAELKVQTEESRS